MADSAEKYVFVLQHRHERFDLMPFTIAQTWREDKGADLVLYVMYEAIELLRKDVIVEYPDLRQAVDALLQQGVPIYACGFCSRACQLSAESYYPGVQVGNRRVFYSLMTERRQVYW